MTRIAITLLSLLISINYVSAQGVDPGCYCIEGQLQTVSAGEVVSSILAGTQYSSQPCQTAFGQPDGTNCAACVCSDQFNDAGFFQIQSKNLFTSGGEGSFDLVTCDEILSGNETLLNCGSCGTNMLGGDCGDFVAPDLIVTPPDPTNTIPTMGEWSLIMLSLVLLIFSIVAVRAKVLSSSKA